MIFIMSQLYESTGFKKGFSFAYFHRIWYQTIATALYYWVIGLPA